MAAAQCSRLDFLTVQCRGSCSRSRPQRFKFSRFLCLSWAEKRLFNRHFNGTSECTIRFRQRTKLCTLMTTVPSISPRRLVVFSSHSKGEDEDETGTVKKADEYSATFQEATKSDLTYRHELGMNYNRVLPNLIVGSCLQNPADVDRLKKDENVTTVCNLQQDPDMAFFDVNISEIREHAKEVGGLEHIRLPIRDMDGYDLRMRLPSVIASLHQELKDREGTTYIHCTAGLGRAPAVALGYMFWVLGYDLNEANAVLQAKRRCVPSMEAIRAATCDLLTGCTRNPIGLLWRRATCETVEVAGLDVGWHSRLLLDFVRSTGHWTLDHELPVGRYEYKYVIDKEKWTFNPHAPLTKPDKKGNCNNYIEVVDRDTDNWNLRKYLMREDARLTEEQRRIILGKLEAMGSEL